MYKISKKVIIKEDNNINKSKFKAKININQHYINNIKNNSNTIKIFPKK